MRIALIALFVVVACAGAPAPQSTVRPADSGTQPPPDAGVPPDSGAPPDDAGAPPDAGSSADGSTPDAGTAPQHGWNTAWKEDFESGSLPQGAWSPDPVPDDGPFADNGSFFSAQGVVPPKAFRTSVPFGQDNWLTAESYTRDSTKPFSALLSVVADPSGAPGHVLRLASPEHTDATVVRPSQPLPDRYRISLRVGFANFGDGKPGLNGYSSGTETAEPWHPNDAATGQNGFYWLTILDSMPRPHNNTWIHHHRKVVIDSDNNTPPWMEMWNGTSFNLDGENPVMMIALDGAAPVSDLYGNPFYSYSNGAWQPSGDIRAVDAYLPNEWYTASIERNGGKMTLQVSGRFKYGGVQTYTASIDLAASCVWHFNQTAAEANPSCDGPAWPHGSAFPDWFMFGDPHNNYYEGFVYYDDVKLETWTE